MENFDKPEGQTLSDNFLASEFEKDFLRSQSQWGEMSSEENEYVGKKGFKSPTDLLKSYRELEKAYSQKVSIPKDGDKKAFDKLYSRLGMPQDTSGFDIDFAPDDKELGEEFKQVCFDNHILPQSAKALYEWYQKNREATIEKMNNQSVDESFKNFAEQENDWGTEAPRKLELMKRGIRMFSDDAEVVNAMEEAMGTKQMMQVFSRLGEAISEDNSVAFGNRAAQSSKFDAVAYYREMFNDF